MWDLVSETTEGGMAGRRGQRNTEKEKEKCAGTIDKGVVLSFPLFIKLSSCKAVGGLMVTQCPPRVATASAMR